ncbi:hypothetical protein ACH4SP_11560 [Streptomyces sp. NPDC021093]|uniref:hypothetical protein n=1 Tax=Streptomyces sp. NPDC021093 TaxID=3365112 RepID=UPI003791CAD3
MTAKVTDAGLVVSGTKKPCGPVRSMGLLTASVLVPREDDPGEQLAVVLVPADGPGIRVTPFWNSFALAGAESDEGTVTDVLEVSRGTAHLGLVTASAVGLTYGYGWKGTLTIHLPAGMNEQSFGDDAGAIAWMALRERTYRAGSTC